MIQFVVCAALAAVAVPLMCGFGLIDGTGRRLTLIGIVEMILGIAAITAIVLIVANAEVPGQFGLAVISILFGLLSAALMMMLFTRWVHENHGDYRLGRDRFGSFLADGHMRWMLALANFGDQGAT
jgi:hypothetical protein